MDLPLEIQDKQNFEELDEMQINFICKQNALDLVLVENANELFRILMQEGNNNNNIEKILKEIGKERRNTIALPSQTFEVKQTIKGNWVFTNTSTNREALEEYIKLCNKKVVKTHNSTIIYTIIGLDLGEGGHYAAFICDIEEKVIYIFDSMSGYIPERDEYIVGGLDRAFKQVAKRLFIGEHAFTGLKALEKYKFTIKSVYNPYVLQPTGGFEEFISPSLQSLEKKKPRLMREINIQHTDSQNHFCYIWSIWFIQIYLRGKIDLYDEIIQTIAQEEMITLVVIKKYIAGIVSILGNTPHPKFFNAKFKQIWSNHEHPLENKFSLYQIEIKPATNMKDCLDNSIKDYKLKKIPITNSSKIKKLIC
jgi:hypothetical protein